MYKLFKEIRKGECYRGAKILMAFRHPPRHENVGECGLGRYLTYNTGNIRNWRNTRLFTKQDF